LERSIDEWQLFRLQINKHFFEKELLFKGISSEIFDKIAKGNSYDN